MSAGASAKKLVDIMPATALLGNVKSAPTQAKMTSASGYVACSFFLRALKRKGGGGGYSIGRVKLSYP